MSYIVYLKHRDLFHRSKPWMQASPLEFLVVAITGTGIFWVVALERLQHGEVIL